MLSQQLEQRQDRILRLLRAREEAGMRELFHFYGGALLGMIEPVVKERTVAEEVLHDVLIKIWDRIEDYDADKSRLFTWMARIARNAAIDKTRSREYRELGKTVSLSAPTTKVAGASQTPSVEHIGVADLIEKLDNDHRTVIQLLFLNQFTQTEAAKHLNIPLGTIKTRSRRALRQLRTLLQSEMIWLAAFFHFLIEYLPTLGS